MILPDSDIEVWVNDNTGEVEFRSQEVDLDNDSVVVPIGLGGATGTVEITHNTFTVHPANGKSFEVSPQKLVEMMREGGFEIPWSDIDDD